MNESTLIRFDAHPDGKIETRSDCPSSFSYLKTLFAVSGIDTGDIEAPYPTDAKGAARLSDIADQAEDAIGDTIAIIGDLLSMIDTDKDTPDMVRLGFVLRGLSDLRADVAMVGRNAEFQRRQMEGRAAPSPKAPEPSPVSRQRKGQAPYTASTTEGAA